jgi:predicted ATP-grasp superfamily ATP-dependent carboligase
MNRILVTDGNQRSALAVVRALGRAGHHVVVCSVGGRSLAGASRFARLEASVPDAGDEPDAYAHRIGELCREHRIDVLIPVTDAAIEAVLPSAAELAPTRIPLPPYEVYHSISDKRGLMERARELGVPTPPELELPDAATPLDEAALPRFPVVVKPARSVVNTGDGEAQIRTSVAHAVDRNALDDVLRRAHPQAYPLLIQEYIPGVGEGAFFLMWEGEAVARFSHRRIREKPPAAGVSVYREAIPLAADLEDYSRRLLDDFGWTGVAMVEYRRSLVDGIPYLMEVNGRFWGSLQLAVDAGVDFPSLLVDCVLGLDPEPVTSYRDGVRSRWWLGDLDHLIIRMKESTPRYRLPPDAGSRPGALLRFLVPWMPGDRSEVLRLSDPGPGLRELWEWIRNSGRALRRKT